VGFRAMSDRRRVDEPHENVPQSEREELPGILPRPHRVEPVYRPAVSTRRWFSMRIRRDLQSGYMPGW
jgi:hypothetical protein